MRKIYIFAVLAFLTFVCVGTVRATYVPDPDFSALTEVKEGDQFFLRAAIHFTATGEAFDNGFRWITLHTPYAVGQERLETVENDGSIMSDAGIFTVEASGTTLVTLEDVSYEGFYLKNVKTGLYVTKNGAVSGNAVFLGLTADQSQALVWGFRPVTDMDPSNEYAVDRFFIFTITDTGVLFLNGGWLNYDGIITPFYGGWSDGPAWFDLIRPVEVESDYTSEHLRLYQQTMVYGSQDAEGRYIIYGGIGGYADDLVKEYNELMYYNTDDLIYLETTGKTVDWADIISRLEALLLRMESAEIQYPVEGYYRFINALPVWSEESEWRAVYSSDNLLYWDTFEGKEKNPAYVWHITRKDDGTYRIQSLTDGLLLTNCARNTQASLTTHEDFGCQLIFLGKGQFHIRIGADSDHDMHPAGHNSGVGTSGNIIGWPGRIDDVSAWRIMEVDESLYGPYVAEMERKLEEAKAIENFPPKDGYYRIISAYTPWQDKSEWRAVYADENVVKWSPYAGHESDPSYIWHITRKDDGKYRIQSLSEGMLFTSCINNGAATLSLDEDFGADIFDLGMGQVNISVGSATNGGNYIHPKEWSQGVGGPVTGFPGGRNSQSAWQLVPANEAEYGPYVAAMEERLENAKQLSSIQSELIAKIKEIGTATKPAFEYEIPSSAKDVTPTNYSDFWSNAAMLDGAPTEAEKTHTYSWGNDGQGYAALIDENYDTYFHTCWTAAAANIKWSAYTLDGQPAEGATPTTLHNLGMKLTQPVTNVAFQVNARKGNNSYNNPVKIDVEVSNDGIHWTTIFYGYDFFKPQPSYDNPYLMGPFELGGSYQYVRFANYANDRNANGSRFFCFSELKVYEGAQLSSTCQASTMDQTIVNNFLQAYSQANRYADIVTIDEVNDMRTALNRLQAAYEAFTGNFANPEELLATLTDAGKVIDGYKAGDDMLGQYDGSVDINDLKEAVNDATSMLAAGYYTKDQLEEAQERINEEMARLETTRVQPEADNWYQLVFPSLEEYDENPDWSKTDAEYNVGDTGDMSLALYSRVASIMNGNDSTPFDDIEALYESNGLRVYSVHEELISDNPEVSYFRFIPVEEGKYVLQNKATGLYIGNLGHGSQIALTSTPGTFTIKYLGKGCCLLVSEDYWSGESSGQSIHFAWNYGNSVMGWGDTTIGSKSSIHVRKVEGETGDATLHRSASPDAAFAMSLIGGVKEVEGGEVYVPVGIYVDDEDEDNPISYIGMKQLSPIRDLLVRPGQPVVVLPEAETVTFTMTRTLTKDALWEHGLRGTFQRIGAAEAGSAVLVFDKNEGDNCFRVIGGAVQYSVDAYGAYLTLQDKNDLPILEYQNDYDFWIVVRGQLKGTGIRSLTVAPDLRGTVYDLKGRNMGTSLSNLKRGLYIVNGKKILVN